MGKVKNIVKKIGNTVLIFIVIILVISFLFAFYKVLSDEIF